MHITAQKRVVKVFAAVTYYSSIQNGWSPPLCSNGMPTRCNAGCATVLHAVQSTCSEFLGHVEGPTAVAFQMIKQRLDDAAALCPPAQPPSPPPTVFSSQPRHVIFFLVDGELLAVATLKKHLHWNRFGTLKSISP